MLVSNWILTSCQLLGVISGRGLTCNIRDVPSIQFSSKCYVMVVVVAISSREFGGEFWGEGSTIHSPPALFLLDDLDFVSRLSCVRYINCKL